MADPASPVGVWKTIDDATGAPKGLVRIYEQNGALFGRIEKTLDPAAPRTCVACPGDRKDRAMAGLEIIRNMTRDGDGYAGGDILDPKTGTIYRCQFHLEAGGAKLAVRGYVGVSILGRTQTWIREQ